jgi:glycerophosphoryl diester phosphodiesterase
MVEIIRGARSIAPENTLAAAELACKIGDVRYL